MSLSLGDRCMAPIDLLYWPRPLVVPGKLFYRLLSLFVGYAVLFLRELIRIFMKFSKKILALEQEAIDIVFVMILMRMPKNTVRFQSFCSWT